MWTRLAALPLMVLLTPLTAPLLGAELTVGLDKSFTRIEAALAKASPGDVILVYPLSGAQPYAKVAVSVAQPNITFRAVASSGQRVRLSGLGYNYSGRGSTPRAIFQFNRGADNCVLEGFELSEAHNDSHNGAGVRINQANAVTVRDCHIHDNDMGLMSNGDGTKEAAVNQRIESCLIRANGNLLDPGYNHNLYLGGTSVTLSACEIHSSLTGHNVKSRAHRIHVEYCYIHDSSNREFDLVDAKGDTDRPGSDAVLLGNVIVKAKHCQGNRGVIHFGQDGGNEHDGTLCAVHNTIVTPYISPVVQLTAGKAKVHLLNNIIWDFGSRQAGQKLLESKRSGLEAIRGSNNWLSAGFRGETLAELKLDQIYVAATGENPPFAASEKGDCRLSRSDKSIVSAGLPWSKCKQAFSAGLDCGGKLYQYRSPLGREPRLREDQPEIGAYELGGR